VRRRGLATTTEHDAQKNTSPFHCVAEYLVKQVMVEDRLVIEGEAPGLVDGRGAEHAARLFHARWWGVPFVM